MSRKVKSIKGDIVDFDLFEVKRKIGEKPISADVENREKFIYSKRRRGSKKVINTLLKNKTDQAKVDQSIRAVEFNKNSGGASVTEKISMDEKNSPEPKQKRRIVKKKK